MGEIDPFLLLVSQCHDLARDIGNPEAAVDDAAEKAVRFADSGPAVLTLQKAEGDDRDRTQKPSFVDIDSVKESVPEIVGAECPSLAHHLAQATRIGVEHLEAVLPKPVGVLIRQGTTEKQAMAAIKDLAFT
jgi:hypothetical protein